MDKNKTESKKTYTVHVNEEQVETPTPQQSNGGNSYTPPVSNGGGGSSNTTPPTTTCSANGQWKSLGNSGYASYDYSTALQWGKDNCPANNRVVVATVKDICGNDGYSVGFYPLKQ